ncbi:MAG: hypothetical protein GY749_45860, partial [Desulfobacteraceae bacterium]|nr:hypothetical protein [Desulfobacteraceae bacterium]
MNKKFICFTIAALICFIFIGYSNAKSNNTVNSRHGTISGTVPNLTYESDSFLFTANTKRSSKKAFLLAGQSNMEGHVNSGLLNNIINEISNGTDYTLKSRLEDVINYWYETDDDGYTYGAWSGDVSAFEAQELVRLYNAGLVDEHITNPNPDVWCSFNSNNVGRLTVGYGYPFGPELIMGHYLSERIDSSFSLIKVAHGGTTLHTDWLSPTAAAKAGKSTGPYYTELVEKIRSLDSNPSSINPDGDSQWSAFVWFQGENDCFDQEGAYNYGQNLKDLIADVRDEIGSDTLSVIIVEIGYWAQSLEFGNQVQQAQANVAKNDPYVYLVKTDDLSHFYHYDSAAQLIIGERIGKAIDEQNSCTAPVVNVTGTSTDSISLSWNTTGINSYTVYYNPSDAGWKIAAPGLNSTSYVITGLTADTSCQIAVLGECSDGTKPYKIITATTEDEQNSCTAPVVNVTGTSADSISLS